MENLVIGISTNLSNSILLVPVAVLIKNLYAPRRDKSSIGKKQTQRLIVCVAVIIRDLMILFTDLNTNVIVYHLKKTVPVISRYVHLMNI